MKKISAALFALIGLISNTSSQGKLTISLAEWSVHKAIQGGKLTNLEFPGYARTEFNIGAVEYVSVLFGDKNSIEDTIYLNKLKSECTKHNVISHLIMVDGEGNLGDTCSAKRTIAVENHYKWIRGAQFLGCKSIRVNAHGEGSPEQVQKAAIDGLSQLCDYAAKFNINIIVENHWGNSSNPEWLMATIKAVNKPNIGTLPDFGNFDKADRYDAVAQMLPYAKGVSAKTYDFDKNGNETKIDYHKMMDIVKKSGFNGYVGIEYEGEGLTEKEGIEATIRLLKKCR